ncbi:uncharacterized protein LOC120645740, partial [Panicum virgatum]|uniref:uncharacterized protein LOC120645740 n=1 Tax=Panicum virgatum TaxID=38727 RepID=UPI0019D5C625
LSPKSSVSYKQQHNKFASQLLAQTYSADACSICLEAFCESDPSALTSCKHEFHLQCILEWCQRSSQCPMCWQPISMKDPTSQELLEAVECEKNIRTNQTRNTTIFHHPALGDFELQHVRFTKLLNDTFLLALPMADDWTTTYCINEDGFPKVLYAATVRLGIPERPEYIGREFMEHGTESCEVTIQIGASDKYLEMQP